ncbi:MAG: efflux RND transporter periplasmic adaptor subunit [Bacteroidota bacterium]
MSRTAIVVILVAIVALLLSTGYYLYLKDQEAPIKFGTENAQTRTIVKKTVATGSVVPRREVEMKPQVSGVIDKIYVEEGQIIRKGDLIARVRIIPNMVTLNNAENRLSLSKIALQNAKREYDRNKGLFEEGVIAESAYRQFELTYENAKEERQNAEDNLDLIKRGSSRRSGKFTNTNVRSTITGMILTVPVEVGNSVIEANTFNDGTTIATVANMDQMIFEGKVDESDVGKIRTGMDLILRIGAIEDETFLATLERISPKGVEENGAIKFEIVAALQKPDSNQSFIRANYSANADIVLEQKDSVLAISESLLQFQNDSPFVEVETSEQQFEKRQIKTGLSDGIFVEVVEGIQLQDNIKNPQEVIEQ